MTAVPDASQVRADVMRALSEDIGAGDLTAGLLAPGTQLRTRVICRESAIFCGRPWFEEVFRQLAGEVSVQWSVDDGQVLSPDQEVCRLEGDAAAILSGERSALNFIQTLSATATQTREFVNAVDGSPARILDTRKTVPGLRRAQKYAVRCGGGTNHRVGLFDAVLIKENHIAAAGGILAAVHTALQRHPGVMVEVEVETLQQLSEVLGSGAHRALLDNFKLDELKAAVAACGEELELEASGDVRIENVPAIAATGVDFISTGAITKHVRAIDFSMRFV